MTSLPTRILTLAAAVLIGAPAHGATDFNRDVRPILNRHCTACHGGVKQAGGVSFVLRSKALGTGKSGEPTVVPGRPEASEMIRRIGLPESDDDHMPPADHAGGAKLGEDEIRALREWVAEGAAWGEHWSLQPPTDPPLPAVGDPGWPRSGLDRFLLARLEEEGLRPAPPADPAQWLRRATLDLTGLPPTPAEVDGLVTGLETPEAAVDRLLASPQFGERWASLWMDLARYADTQGYEKDNGRPVWPWRDWLIRALNDDLPFDQFTLRVLAGDLLPDATLADQVATGFHRNTQTNTEGGTDDEEFRLHAVIDRVNTTWTVWMGTTFGCVQCHSHPYDAFTHEEYYRFLSLWNSTEDADLGDDFPRIRVPRDPARDAEARDIDQSVRRLRRALNEPGRILAGRTDWTPLTGLTVTGPKDARFQVTGNEIRAGGTIPNGAAFSIRVPAGTTLGALRMEILPEGDDPAKWPENGAVVGEFSMEIHDPARIAGAGILAARIREENRMAKEEDDRAIAAAEKEGRTAPKRRDPKPLPDGIERIPFKAVFADTLTGPFDPEESLRPGGPGGGAFPKLFGPRWLVFVPERPVRAPEGAALRLRLKHDIFDAETKGSIVRRFRLSLSEEPAWFDLIASEERAGIRAELDRLRARRDAIPSDPALVMRERPADARRETRVFLRGNFLARDRVVEPGVPAVLPPLSDGPPDRLAVARWLVSPDHPLTARVFVNRIWAELFGVGIVETLEDFGSTGTAPSHPDLLDHLAVRFRTAQRWSLKALLRELVLSAAYRQDHRVTPALLERDPANRLLARGPRTRLSAEMVRDQALAAAGLLGRKLYGPPVMPPQPDGVWQVVYSGARWETPDNEDRYRRALYTYWRRTSPYPSFMTFDAVSREVCTARRVVTSTPLQALVTLNDPVYHEAARGLASRMQAAASDPAERIVAGHRAVTGLVPDPETVDRLVRLQATALDAYRADPELAGKAAGTPVDAAWALVASTLLNLDAALTK